MRNRGRSVLLAALTAALAVGGCDAGTAATPPPSIEGTTWRAVEIAGQLLPGGSLPSLTIDGGRIRGDTGCNSFTATVTAGAGSIDVADVSSTLRLCDGQVGATETAFMRALVGATAVAFDAEGDLHLTGDGGEVRFVAR